MYIFHLSLFLLTFVAFSITTHAATPSHTPLATSTVSVVGYTTDGASNPGIYHDGGGGVSQNGYNMIIFADSYTNGSHPSFQHNSVAYYGYRNATDPTNLYTFGMSGAPGQKSFSTQPFAAVQANETALGANFSIWAGLNSMAPLPDGKTVVGTFSCFNEATGVEYYSTMATINMTNPTLVPAGSFPPTKRVVPQLFYPGEVYYGNFGLVAGIDGYLYMLGSDKTGFKLARVPISSMTNRAQYTYYSAATKTYSATPPRYNDSSANILSYSADFFGTTLSPFSSDAYYSPYHGTMLLVFMDSGVDGVFRASYSTTGAMEGPWSAPIQLYTPPIPAACVNAGGLVDIYSGHALWGFDTTGKTLLLSYSSCANVVGMARVIWA